MTFKPLTRTIKTPHDYVDSWHCWDCQLEGTQRTNKKIEQMRAAKPKPTPEEKWEKKRRILIEENKIAKAKREGKHTL